MERTFILATIPSELPSELSSELSTELRCDFDRHGPNPTVLRYAERFSRRHLRSCCLRSIERAHLDDPRIDDRSDSIDERLRRVFFVDQPRRLFVDQRPVVDQSSESRTIAGRDR